MKQYDAKAIGERIRAKRNELCLSQQELCKESGISQEFLSLVESGKRNMSGYYIVSLCNALGIGSDYLLFGNEDSQFGNPIVESVWDLVTDNRLVEVVILETGEHNLMLDPRYSVYDEASKKWLEMDSEQLKKLKRIQDVVQQKSMTDEDVKEARKDIFDERDDLPF